MELVEKRIYYISLLHLYGELLSLSQKEVLTDYLEYDLSISEIASEKNISRAAVEDAIKKGKKKLDQFEGKLKLLEKKEIILKNTAILKQKLEKCEEIEEIEEALQ